MISSLFMQKRGFAIQAIAVELMPLRQGDKIPTITELSERLKISRGNVQYALENLRSHGVVRLLARGHLGTVIEMIDYLRMAQICGISGVVGVMPLPYTKQYEGLATGLYSALNTDQMEGNIAFMRGSGNRLKLLLSKRYDFAVMSFLAYERYAGQGNAVTLVKDLGPGSYVNKHVVMTRVGFNGDFSGKKIGIDYSSFDQMQLTQSYFADKNVEFVPLMYSRILQFLLDGSIDAGVWNIDDVGIERPNILMHELDNPGIGTENTQAVVVCRADDSVTIRILSELLDVNAILEEQRQVVHGERIPGY